MIEPSSKTGKEQAQANPSNIPVNEVSMALQDTERPNNDGEDDVFRPYEIVFNVKFSLDTACTIMGHMVMNLWVMKSLGTVTIVSEAGNHFSFRPGPDFDGCDNCFRDQVG